MLVAHSEDRVDILVCVANRIAAHVDVVSQHATILQVLKMRERHHAPVRRDAIHLKAVVRRDVSRIALLAHRRTVHLERCVDYVTGQVGVSRYVRVNNMQDQTVPVINGRVQLHLKALLADLELHYLRQDVV